MSATEPTPQADYDLPDEERETVIEWCHRWACSFLSDDYCGCSFDRNDHTMADLLIETVIGPIVARAARDAIEPCAQDDHDRVWQMGREAGHRDALIGLAEHRGKFFDELDRNIADSLRRDREYVEAHDAAVLRSAADALDGLQAPENDHYAFRDTALWLHQRAGGEDIQNGAINALAEAEYRAGGPSMPTIWLRSRAGEESVIRPAVEGGA